MDNCPKKKDVTVRTEKD